jgi:hypothetical protein
MMVDERILMMDVSTTHESGNAKAAGIPLEVRDLGGVAAAQSGFRVKLTETADYNPIS